MTPNRFRVEFRLNGNHYLPGFRSKGNSWEMATVKQTRPWVRRSTSVLMGGGLVLSAFGLAGGPSPCARLSLVPG